MSDGWVKFYRQLLEKAVWKTSTPEQKTILVTLLLLASHKANEWEWKGKRCVVLPGQMITSLPSIKKAAGKGISIQNIRTSLKRFKKFEFLTDESTGGGRLITIMNWQSYQSDSAGPNRATNRPLTDSQQTPNSYQECKNVKEGKKLIKHSALEILNYLNEKTGKAFRRTEEIEVRLTQGITVEQCKQIIDNKSLDPHFIANPKYLSPRTLFRKSHIDDYLNYEPEDSSNSKTSARNANNNKAIEEWENEFKDEK